MTSDLSSADQSLALRAGAIVGEAVLSRPVARFGDLVVYEAEHPRWGPVWVHEFWPARRVNRAAQGALNAALPAWEPAFAQDRAAFADKARFWIGMPPDPSRVRGLAAPSQFGAPFLITERPAGRPLAAALDDPWLRSQEGLEAAAAQLSLALAPLHEAGLGHGDLSPDAVFIHQDQVQLAGPGLPSRETAPRGYAPPERDGDPGPVATAAADAYGVSAILFRLATGQDPTDARQRLYRGQDETAVALGDSALPRALLARIDAGLDLEPKSRPPLSDYIAGWSPRPRAPAVAGPAPPSPPIQAPLGAAPEAAPPAIAPVPATPDVAHSPAPPAPEPPAVDGEPGATPAETPPLAAPPRRPRRPRQPRATPSAQAAALVASALDVLAAGHAGGTPAPLSPALTSEAAPPPLPPSRPLDDPLVIETTALPRRRAGLVAALILLVLLSLLAIGYWRNPWRAGFGTPPGEQIAEVAAPAKAKGPSSPARSEPTKGGAANQADRGAAAAPPLAPSSPQPQSLAPQPSTPAPPTSTLATASGPKPSPGAAPFRSPPVRATERAQASRRPPRQSCTREIQTVCDTVTTQENRSAITESYIRTEPFDYDAETSPEQVDLLQSNVASATCRIQGMVLSGEVVLADRRCDEDRCHARTTFSCARVETRLQDVRRPAACHEKIETTCVPELVRQPHGDRR